MSGTSSPGELPRLSRLKVILEREVPPLESPSVSLEQYTTPAELAIIMASRVLALGLLEGATVADLGAGTCRIAIAALLLGASRAIAVDVDQRLATPCIKAAERLGLSGRLGYVTSWIADFTGPLRPGAVDVVLMNPPFGVHRRGADTEFIKYAASLRPKIVVALVKSGNYSYHAKLSETLGYRISLLGTYAFPIPATMPHHRSRIARIEVDLVELRREGDARRSRGGR